VKRTIYESHNHTYFSNLLAISTVLPVMRENKFRSDTEQHVKL